MRCCANLLSALVLLLLLAAPTAQATDISLRNPEISLTDDGYAISADFNINFNSRLEAAVNKGIVLYFAVDFEVTRSRWYWIDEQIIRRNRTLQLSYHALTRQYRLSTGALHQGFATLDEAMEMVSRLRNWQVIDKGELKPDQTYLAALRMRLDLSQMPKTFQVTALSNRDWNLSSDWVRWSFNSAESQPLPSGIVASPVLGPTPPVSPAGETK